MVDGPVTNRRFSRRTVRKAVIISVCVLVFFLVAGGAWKMFSSLSASSEKEELQARDVAARNIATNVQQNLGQLKEKLSALAKDAQTIELFQQDADAATLRAVAAEKEPLFDQALKLRYLNPGSYSQDDSEVPPLSYASLDMLNKAETTSQINTEVHLFGAINQHVVMIERVVNNAFELIGLLHLSLNVSLLNDLLNGIDLDNGYAELTQRAAGKTLVLAKIGDESQRQGAATTVSVNDTRWIIAYWSGSSPIMSEGGASSSIIPIILIVLALLLIGAGVYFVVIKKGSSSSEDVGDLLTYEGAVRAIAEGAHAGVEQLIPHLPKADRITSKSKATVSRD